MHVDRSASGDGAESASGAADLDESASSAADLDEPASSAADLDEDDLRNIFELLDVRTQAVASVVCRRCDVRKEMHIAHALEFIACSIFNQHYNTITT